MSHFLTIDSIYEQLEMDEHIPVSGIAILNEEFKMEHNYTELSHQFDGLLISYCLKGDIQAKINFTEYKIETGSIIVVLPQLMMDPIHASDDLNMISIAMSLDFISAFPVLREFITNDEIRWQPVIHLKQQDRVLFEEFITYLQKYYKSKDKKNKRKVLQYLIFALITSTSDFYSSLSLESDVRRTRKNEIIDEFYVLISKHAHYERRVSYYADKLNLSPQYLTTLVKGQTGKSINKWIEHVVIMHAKSLLKSTPLSVKEVSQELNFSDVSIFCRYFKRCTKMTPNTFRNNLG